MKEEYPYKFGLYKNQSKHPAYINMIQGLLFICDGLVQILSLGYVYSGWGIEYGITYLLRHWDELAKKETKHEKTI